MQKEILSLGLFLTFSLPVSAGEETAGNSNQLKFKEKIEEVTTSATEQLDTVKIKELKIGEDLLGNKDKNTVTVTFQDDDSLPPVLRSKKITFMQGARLEQLRCLTNIERRIHRCQYIKNQDELDGYLAKEQALEAFSLSNGLRAAIVESHANTGEWPADNAKAGVAGPEEIQGKYVKEVRIGTNLSGNKQPGVITAALDNEEPVVSALRGKKLSFVPKDTGGAYQWDCASNIDDQYLPEPCRSIKQKEQTDTIAEGKRQAAEALNLAGGQKAAVSESYADKGTWPKSNKAVGAAEPFDIRGKYVKEVRIGTNLSGNKQPGVITATLDNEEPVVPALHGKKLSYVPEENGAFQWDCISNIDSQYLPEPCRHVDK
ncbi:pilin [uncultured Cardiobacterium sp.]|uniref:pilin n=1 Tax=uncultured Cardiobacterium sp. TaxID=417619 RepID=UPI00262E9872|nr:pilin [uncultured Cardiobacterium sp.]